MNQNSAPNETYHCPLCTYTSAGGGQCPQHQVPLLGLSTWLEFKRKRDSSRPKHFGPLLLVLLVLVAAFVVFYFARKVIPVAPTF